MGGTGNDGWHRQRWVAPQKVGGTGNGLLLSILLVERRTFGVSRSRETAVSDENPYSVMEYSQLGPAADRADTDEAKQLLLIASGQRMGKLLTVCHLGIFGVVMLPLALYGPPYGPPRPPSSIDSFLSFAVPCAALLWLASRVWCLFYVARGYVSALNLPLALCGFIPVFGLLPYLLVWFNATRKLEKHGIRVGFFGASREHVLEALRK